MRRLPSQRERSRQSLSRSSNTGVDSLVSRRVEKGVVSSVSLVFQHRGGQPSSPTGGKRSRQSLSSSKTGVDSLVSRRAEKGVVSRVPLIFQGLGGQPSFPTGGERSRQSSLSRLPRSGWTAYFPDGWKANDCSLWGEFSSLALSQPDTVCGVLVQVDVTHSDCSSFCLLLSHSLVHPLVHFLACLLACLLISYLLAYLPTHLPAASLPTYLLWKTLGRINRCHCTYKSLSWLIYLHIL